MAESSHLHGSHNATCTPGTPSPRDVWGALAYCGAQLTDCRATTR
ncbi:hypothetical protein [Formicincola oecophyllae]|nr:hypothetical protein [Formicincola oecophyllae]